MVGVTVLSSNSKVTSIWYCATEQVDYVLNDTILLSGFPPAVRTGKISRSLQKGLHDDEDERRESLLNAGMHLTGLVSQRTRRTWCTRYPVSCLGAHLARGVDGQHVRDRAEETGAAQYAGNERGRASAAGCFAGVGWEQLQGDFGDGFTCPL